MIKLLFTLLVLVAVEASWFGGDEDTTPVEDVPAPQSEEVEEEEESTEIQDYEEDESSLGQAFVNVR